DGEVGQDLAVDLDARGVEAGDESAVAHAVLAAPGVDPLDPKATEIALEGHAVAAGVLPRVHDLLVGGAVRTALVAVVTLGPLEDLPAVLLRRDGSLGPGPQRLLSDKIGGTDSSALGEQALDPLLVAAVHGDVAVETAC